MVDFELFRGNEKLRVWFDHALRHNRTLCAKEPSDKPRRRSHADGEDADTDADHSRPPAPPPPRRRPASTSGGAFARCVLHVIEQIPSGAVASYGQVAALAGAPRNARQVGALLRDGLCRGGAPWHRVLGSSGRVSLPRDSGGTVQRQMLDAEGIAFGPSDAVTSTAWWARSTPFFE